MALQTTATITTTTYNNTEYRSNIYDRPGRPDFVIMRMARRRP